MDFFMLSGIEGSKEDIKVTTLISHMSFYKLNVLQFLIDIKDTDDKSLEEVLSAMSVLF